MAAETRYTTNRGWRTVLEVKGEVEVEVEETMGAQHTRLEGYSSRI
jgi:hypothetical protein